VEEKSGLIEVVRFELEDSSLLEVYDDDSNKESQLLSSISMVVKNVSSLTASGSFSVDDKNERSKLIS
jgi:hypothetical protein